MTEDEIKQSNLIDLQRAHFDKLQRRGKMLDKINNTWTWVFLIPSSYFLASILMLCCGSEWADEHFGYTVCSGIAILLVGLIKKTIK